MRKLVRGTFAVAIATTLIAALVAASPRHALAQVDECTGLVITPRIVDIDAEQWVAMPHTQAACLAKRSEQAARLHLIVVAQAREVALQRQQTATATAALAASKRVSAAHQERANAALDLSQRQAKEIESLNAWHRQPTFWAAVGAGTAVLLLTVLHASLR